MPQPDPRATPAAGGTSPSESNVSDVTGQAQQKAQEAAGQAQEKAQQAAGQLQDRLRAQIDQRSTEVAAQVKEQGSDLRSVGESLREQGKDGPAKAADRLAAYAEKAAAYLDGKDSQALLADAEDFGRRQPWAAAAGGLVLGFGASRFLKASSGERYRTNSTAGRPLPARAGVGVANPGPYTAPGSLTPGAAPGVL